MKKLNIEAQYECVYFILESYFHYSYPVHRRLFFRFLFWYWGTPQLTLRGYYQERTVGILFQSNEMINLIQQNLKTKESSSPFKEVLLANYPLESLAKIIEKDLPKIDFVKLEELHNLRKKKDIFLTSYKFLGFGSLSVGLFLMNSLPSSIKASLSPILFKTASKTEDTESLIVNFDEGVFFITLMFVWICFISALCYKLARGNYNRKVRRFLDETFSFFAIRSK